MSRIIKKINSRPVHSPSPDIAHRNIITRTQAPLDEVLRKSRMNSTGPQPLSLSFPSVEELQRALADMHEKYNLLYKQYLQLIEHNKALQNQGHSSLIPSARSGVQGRAERQAEEEHLLEAYERRIGELMQEMKRIQKKLKDTEEEKKRLEKENEGLKWGNNLQNARHVKSIYYDQQGGLPTAEIQRELNQELARLSSDLEHKVNQYLNGLNQRVNEVQNSQLALSRLQHRKEFATPDTHRKSGRIDSSRTPDNKKFSRKSPAVEEFEREQQNLNREIVAQQEEIESLRRQNSSLKKLLDSGSKPPLILEKSSHNLTRDESKFDCPSCRKLQRKVSELQQLLRVKKASYEQLERDEQILREQLERKTIALDNCAANSILIRNGLNEVRTQLQSKEIDSLLQQNELIQSQIYGVDSKIKDLHDQYERIYHQKQVQLSLALMDAKKESELLKVQVREQAEQISKLHDIIGQKLRDNTQMRKDSSHSRIDLTDENKKFRELLNQAISKIENLEEKIETTLEQ